MQYIVCILLDTILRVITNTMKHVQIELLTQFASKCLFKKNIFIKIEKVLRSSKKCDAKNVWFMFKQSDKISESKYQSATCD